MAERYNPKKDQAIKFLTDCIEPMSKIKKAEEQIAQGVDVEENKQKIKKAKKRMFEMQLKHSV